MPGKKQKWGQKSGLRCKAESALRVGRSEISKMAVHDVQALVNELQVHQIELEMQNEELRRAQLDLVSAVERYFDLYEFAPSVTSRWIREVSSSRQILRLQACCPGREKS